MSAAVSISFLFLYRLEAQSGPIQEPAVGLCVHKDNKSRRATKLDTPGRGRGNAARLNSSLAAILTCFHSMAATLCWYEADCQ